LLKIQKIGYDIIANSLSNNNWMISGGPRIFERGVQVQVDYSNIMDCFIMTGEYV